MAAHVFDATEPTFDTLPNRSATTAGPVSANPTVDGPTFAAHPAVFNKLQARQRVGAGPLIGLAVGAVIVGGLVFAMGRHNPHATSQPPAHSMAAAMPATPPAVNAVDPAPVKATPAPTHLRIVSASPTPARAVRAAAARPAPARSVTQRVTEPRRVQAAPAPAPEVVSSPAPLAITPAPAPAPAPTPAPSAAPEAPAAAPALSTPAPQPTPQPAPAPSTPAPDASASAGQPTPQ